MATVFDLTGRIVFAAVLTWLILLAAMVLMERRFIYFPYRELAAQPSDYGLSAETLWLRAEDGTKLHAWWIRGGGPRVLVWYHGNAGNVSHRLEQARLLVNRFGLDILLADYRGFGSSEGKPDENGLYQDGVAMYRAASERVASPYQIILYGESLGSAVAIETALTRPCGAAILQSPFLSIPKLARDIYKVVPGFLIRTQFDNEKKIAGLAVPKLILHGERDEIVPLTHALRLFEIALEPKRLFVIPGASHNDTYMAGGEAYFGAWERFLQDTMR